MPKTILLELSGKEARALFTVLRSVGGHPEETRRGLTDSILRQLRDGGIKAYRDEEVEGSIYWRKK